MATSTISRDERRWVFAGSAPPRALAGVWSLPALVVLAIGLVWLTLGLSERRLLDPQYATRVQCWAVSLASVAMGALFASRKGLGMLHWLAGGLVWMVAAWVLVPFRLVWQGGYGMLLVVGIGLLPLVLLAAMPGAGDRPRVAQAADWTMAGIGYLGAVLAVVWMFLR